jgi:hypothetical protein
MLSMVLALGVVWTLWAGVGGLGGGPLTAPGPDPSRAVPVVAVIHVVQPGDTVWGIARSFQPGGEIRPLVDRIETELHGQPLQVGDRLVLS